MWKNVRLSRIFKSVGSPQFAYFTFLAVDSAYVQSPHPVEWEIIVCSDAPDYNEDPQAGAKLKVFRMPVREALKSLQVMEMLLSTPLEVAKRCEMRLNVMPEPGDGEPGRNYKWTSLQALPESEGECAVEIFDVDGNKVR